MNRPARVVILSFLIICMSVVDLGLTIMYVKPGLLAEANPFGVFLLSHGILFTTFAKTLMTIMAVAIILNARRRFCGETSAWVCFLVMFVLMAHWANMLITLH